MMNFLHYLMIWTNMGTAKNLLNQKFERLTVIEDCGSNKHKQKIWRCHCKCGSEIIATSSSLLSGNTKSCGCLQREIARSQLRKYNTYDLSGEYGVGYTSNTNHKFYFDLEDYEKIKNYCWCECQGYIETKINNSSIRLHRLLFEVSDKEVIDHINHDTLDNRKYNLRIATVSQNGMNQKLSTRNTSGEKGVSWHKRDKCWRAFITVNKKYIHLGSFNTKDEAILARRKAEEKYFGEYSYNDSIKKEEVNNYGI